MYICKECKAKYKEKVEYCDCGNNTFDYVEEKQPVISQPKTRKSLTLEQKSELVSRIFFAICIILSVIVWAIPVKTAHTTKQQSQTQQNVDTKSIPDINRIWNDTPLYTPQQTVQEQQAQQSPLDELRQEVPLTSAPINNQRISQSEVQKKNNDLIKKNIVSNKVQQSQVKPKTVQNKAKTTVTSSQPQTTKPKVQQQVQKEVQKVTAYNPNSAEMLRYKNRLRAALFRHFAVGSISGSGECSVQFAVNENGKLINRKFFKESSNKALNDAVYYMLMSVPQFEVPPTEYNGQTIRMNFKIDNGNYEISIY